MDQAMHFSAQRAQIPVPGSYKLEDCRKIFKFPACVWEAAPWPKGEAPAAKGDATGAPPNGEAEAADAPKGEMADVDPADVEVAPKGDELREVSPKGEGARVEAVAASFISQGSECDGYTMVAGNFRSTP